VSRRALENSLRELLYDVSYTEIVQALAELAAEEGSNLDDEADTQKSQEEAEHLEEVAHSFNQASDVLDECATRLNRLRV
jgi:hypothetical protein